MNCSPTSCSTRRFSPPARRAESTPAPTLLRPRIVTPAQPDDQPDTESFSSSDLGGLQDVDGLGQLPGLPRAAAEPVQDAPGLELGVGAFAGTAQLGVCAVGGLLRFRLVSSLVWGADVVTGPRRSPCPPARSARRRPVPAECPRSGRRSGRGRHRAAGPTPRRCPRRVWR
jgi:hypothetical protein